MLENSDVDFDRLEADIVQKIYVHLLEKGTLQNLKDLLIFMNYARDCSLTVEQFKMLFMQKLELNMVLSEDEANLIIQRYRVDEQRLAIK